MLHAHDPQAFPWGQVGTSVATLAYTMLRTQNAVASSQLKCTACDYEGPEKDDRLGYAVTATGQQPTPTSKWIATLGHTTQDSCPECMSI